MDKEYENIIALISSDDKTNISLGLTLAQSLGYTDLLDGLRLLIERTTKNQDITAEEILSLLKKQYLYHLTYKNLTEIPREVGLLKKANGFYFYNNNLTKLPMELGTLPFVSTLHLQNNAFEEFPEAVLKLPRLSELFLNRNKISTIPPQIGQCAYLRTLALSRNRLRTLPIEMLRLQYLTNVFLDENPWDFEAIPPEFFDPKKSPKAIFEALSRLRSAPY